MSASASILATCTDGGIGDLLAIVPSLNALHRHFGTPVTVLASPYAAPLLEGHPAVARVLREDPGASRDEVAAQLRAHHFTHAIVFWSNSRVAAYVHKAGIPVRVGQSRRLHSFRYTLRVPVRTETGDTTSHWTDVQMDYVRALGIIPQEEDYRIEIPLRPEDEREADALLAETRIEGPFVALHAARGLSGPFARLGNARTLRMTRVNWPVARFAEIGDALYDAFGFPIVLTGGDTILEIIRDVGAAMRGPNQVIAGRTSVRGLAALYKRAAVVVALDSGPMHIAAAVGAPTVGIFALRSDMPQRWGPLGPRVAIVPPSYACPRGCRKETCKTFRCYHALAPAAVVARAKAVAKTVVGAEAAS